MRRSFTVALLLVCCTSGLSAQQNGFIMSRTDSVLTNGKAEARARYIDGVTQFELEQYDQALELLSAAYIKLPDHAGVNYALADTYFQLDDIANAAYYGKAAVNLEPDNVWYHLKLAQIYRKAGKNDATIEQLEAASKLEPGDVDILYKLARTHASYGDLLESNEVYDRILNNIGPNIGVRLQKFNNFNALNMPDSAIAELEQIQALNPDNLSTLHTLSQFYMEQDKRQKALEILEEARERNPRDPQTLIRLADIYIKESRWDSTGTLLNTLISDSLVSAREKLEIVQFLYSSFQQSPENEQLKSITEQAVADFSETNPDYGMAHAIAADFYRVTNQIERAITELELTNELLPTNDVAWRSRLQLLYSEGRYDEVIAAGQTADEYVPDDPFILFFIGGSHLIKGEHRQATEWLSRAARVPSRRPFKSTVYTTLGDAYAGYDSFEEAFDAYEKAIRLDGENHTALNNYAYFLSVRGEQLDRAKEMALTAMEKDPENASYLDTVGWVFFKLKEYDKALRFIKASIDTGAASAEVLEHLGDVYEARGELEQAQEWWQKALQKDPSRKHLSEKLNQGS